MSNVRMHSIWAVITITNNSIYIMYISYDVKRNRNEITKELKKKKKKKEREEMNGYCRSVGFHGRCWGAKATLPYRRLYFYRRRSYSLRSIASWWRAPTIVHHPTAHHKQMITRPFLSIQRPGVFIFPAPETTWRTNRPRKPFLIKARCRAIWLIKN